MDFLLWEEFIDPARRFECPYCGTLFGDESLGGILRQLSV
jgi:hypothetical protein